MTQLLWIIYPYGDNTEKKLLGRFCELTRLPPPQERYSEIVPLEDDPDALLKEVRCYWDLQAYPANIELLFKEIVKADFGGFRDLEFFVYLLDTKLNMLLNLYDDRGLDIAAESHDMITPFREKCGNWIMDNLSCKTNDLVPDDCENFEHIETLVLSKLPSILDVSKLKKDEQNGYYVIDSQNDLWAEFCGSEVIIRYAKEHHHIMGMDYKTMDEWASEVCCFLGLLVNNTVRFEYHYRGKKQIRVKVYSLRNGKEELIEHVRTTLNPFLLHSKNVKREVKLIEFKLQ